MTTIMQQELTACFTRLTGREQQSFLNILKNFLQNRSNPSGAVTIEAYNEELDAAMARIANNEYTTLEELEKEMAAW